VARNTFIVKRRSVLGRPGSDLLFQVLRLSTIGAGEFNGRVRDGIGFRPPATTTRPAKNGQQRAHISAGVCSLILKQADRSATPADTRSTVWALSNESNQDERAISTGKLNALPRLHTRPINVVVYHGSSGRTGFEVGFPLRCLQRLSRPYIATQHCGWRHNCSTRGTSIPVLSY
jgi:hypothetical protein